VLDYIARHAAEQPEKPALVAGDRTITWREFSDLRNRLGRSLVERGLVPGEHVVIEALNGIEVLLASAGSRAAGAITVPVNHRLTAEEAAYILDNADAAAVFVGDAFVLLIETIRARASTVRMWILIGAERRPAEHLADLIAAGAPEPVAVPEGEAFGASMIFLTRRAVFAPAVRHVLIEKAGNLTNREVDAGLRPLMGKPHAAVGTPRPRHGIPMVLDRVERRGQRGSSS